MIKQLQSMVRCGACGGKLDRLNLCELNYRATWPHPTSANLITGESARAVAMLCDGCIEGRATIKEAVEVRSTAGVIEAIVYHPVESLEPMPPPRTYVLLGPAEAPTAIRCLRCGFTSHNPDDVFHKYCGRCHRFHEV